MQKELKRIENIIITIGELDDSSFTFRYLTDKEGEYIFSNNEIINIENIADKVQDVKTFFEHLKCGFDMLEEVRQIYLKDIGQVRIYLLLMSLMKKIQPKLII